MSDPKEFAPEKSVYTPLEVVKLARHAITDIRENAQRAISIGISGIKDYFAPMLPGQVCAVIAQTSHYKSGFLDCIEYHAARQLMDESRYDEALIHVSVEECVEEQAYRMLGRESGDEAGALARGQVQDWDRLEAAAVRVGSVPIYRIGDSLARAEDMPNLYLSNMVRSIKALADGQVTGDPIRIAALYFDYLQAFPIDPETKGAVQDQQRRLQVRSDIYRLRKTAAYFRCPVFVAVQAKQKLDGAPGSNMLIPGIYDGEESSSIAQRCDRVIQLWMPKQTHTIGATLTHNSLSFRVEENLLWVKVGKQRGGLPSGKVWKCRINFTRNLIAPEYEKEVESKYEPEPLI